MFSFMKNIVLASASPRRLELLRQIGIEPIIRIRPVEEISNLNRPEDLVLENAHRKAIAAVDSSQDEIVIAADTIVAQNGTIFGKPHSPEEAKAMLRSLSGKEHQVYTGCSVINSATGREEKGYRMTAVTFDSLSEKEIENYLATGEPMDKAGAYGIQGKGGLFVRKITGDYGTVVGLSLPLLKDLLKKMEE